MGGPLEGIRVVDCGHWQVGGVAGVMLGDLGADVIKIEDRVHGDPIRGFTAIFSATSRVSGRNYMFEHCDRNKRGITLDLQKEKGREIVAKLVEKSDVFFHNWRQGVAEKLGLDYATLSQNNPRLVYGVGSGWGPEGPEAKDPAMDFAALGRAGTMYLAGDPDMPPLMFMSGIADQMGGIMLVQGILAALVDRERNGIGQKVDVSLLGSMISLEGAVLDARLILGVEMPRRSRSKMGNPLWNFYWCGDDKWIILGALQADRYWSAFCEVIGIQDLEHDSRFENMGVRSQEGNSIELISILDTVFATKPRDEWIELLRGAGIICGRVQTVSEVIEDQQVLANDYIVDFDHPEWGPIKMVGFPYKFSRTPASMRRAAPEFGQHTEEVLLELGYTWDSIGGLREQEII